MAERPLDLTIFQEKDTRKTLNVSRRNDCKIPVHPRHQHAKDGFAIQILAQVSSRQTELFVKLAIGIGKARQIVQFVGREISGRAFFGAQVHERDARAFGLNLGAKFGELGDRLAAKRSAKVTQKDEQEGAFRGNRFDRVAILRAISLQEFRIDALCLEHCRVHLH